ncbi:MAG: hypothetical protein V1489_01190 [Candidatus Liptonbacteria bacterium]
MAEQYNPSEEETNKAEGMEEDLLREQYMKKETERMNQVLGELFPGGFTGFVDKRSKGEYLYDSQHAKTGVRRNQEISGEINGHTFSVQENLEVIGDSHSLGDPKTTYAGVVDNKKINEKTAKDLFWKYYKVARRVNEDSDETSNDSSIENHIWRARHTREEAFETEKYDRAQGYKKSLEDLGL